MNQDITFEPMLTPKEMINKGVFGGTYFTELINYQDYPEDWFKGLSKECYISNKYLPEVNYFKIRSGQTQKE